MYKDVSLTFYFTNTLLLVVSMSQESRWQRRTNRCLSFRRWRSVHNCTCTSLSVYFLKTFLTCCGIVIVVVFRVRQTGANDSSFGTWRQGWSNTARLWGLSLSVTVFFTRFILALSTTTVSTTTWNQTYFSTLDFITPQLIYKGRNRFHPRSFFLT